tara:strand:- start:2565 stop:3116 length:552 start_codon:yes stop_codon:yes gene_type:complete
MRLTDIEIKDIHNGLYRNNDTNSKLLVLNTEGGPQINILLGVGRRETPTQNDIVVLRTPHRYLYQAHIAICYDFLLRDFNIVKHRFGADGRRFNSINQINEVLLEQFIDMGFGRYDAYYIISKLCRCFSLTTDEPIFFSRQSPYGGTMYDLHINGENTTDATVYIGKGIDTMTPIKKEIKHHF